MQCVHGSHLLLSSLRTKEKARGVVAGLVHWVGPLDCLPPLFFVGKEIERERKVFVLGLEITALIFIGLSMIKAQVHNSLFQKFQMFGTV